MFACGIYAPTHRYPATKSDGGNLFNVPVPLPEGARVQLDPAVDVEALPNATPFEKTVAGALQTFGAYNIDNGGYRAMGFSFEVVPPDAPDPYRAAGLVRNYQGMPHIPWDRLRVLRQWDGR